MSDMIQSVRTVAETVDRNALVKEEEAIEVASQWAQERLDNFLSQVECVFFRPPPSQHKDQAVPDY